MTKLFKNSKQVLSFVIAFAIIAVSLFVGVGINADAACATDNIDYWDGTSDTAPTKTEADGTVIIETAEQLAYIAKNGAAQGSKYKISDDIDAFVMQPENSVAATKDEDANGIADVFEFDGYEETKAYFEDASLTDKKSWFSASTGGIFSGELDGNGAGIYGLYVKGGWASTGLFTTVSHNATIKNLAIKNSYIAAGNYVGVLFGLSSSNGNDYVITIDTVEISNCYILNTTEPNGTNDDVLYNRTGIINGNAKNRISINNVILHDNMATNTVGTVIEHAFKVNNSWTEVGVNHRYSNLLIFGARAYDPSTYNAYLAGLYTSVYTDADVTDGRYTYKAEQLAHVDLENAVGAAAENAMPTLDWENTWVATEGFPELRAFHNLTAVTPDANGHGYKCADCDIDAVVAHAWDGNECTECGYTCNHTSQTVTKTDAATCVSKETVYSTCNNCKQELTVQVGVAPVGHNVTWVEPNSADCVNTGVYGYWHCSVCDGNYVAETEEEAKWAPMDSSYANPETDLIIPADPNGGHIKDVDADGKIIVGYDKDGHWYECSVCDGKLDHNSETLPEGQVVAHDFFASVCKECGWKCEKHDYQLTGNILVVGDCYTDHEDELKCTICGKQEIEVIKARHKIVPVEEVKATDNLEGTKAHYQCTECKSIYADVEGKTSVTRASLVIPKKLPAGYENTYGGTGSTTAPENADTSNKSPSTADSVMTVVAAITVLMGAAFVVVRKAVKA